MDQEQPRPRNQFAPRPRRDFEDRPRPASEPRPRRDFDEPRIVRDAKSPEVPERGERPAFAERPGAGPRPWGDDRHGAARASGWMPRGPGPGGRPPVDRRVPRPYVPIRPAVAADPSLGLAGDEELVAGRRPVEEAFVARRESKRLYVVPQRRQALERLVLHATSLRIPVIEVEGGTLTAIAGFDGHQGIALVVAPRRWAGPDDILAVAASRGEAPMVLVMDSLEDPQNVGTLLRTAEASGVHGAVFPTRHQAPLSPSAVKASAGAVEHLALAPVDDLPGTLADLHARGLRIVGADGDASLTAREADLRGPVAIVVGSEGSGLGPAIRRRCDLLVRIPMHGRVQSLNAAVAGSILLYEAAAQRRLVDPGPRSATDEDSTSAEVPPSAAPGPEATSADASPATPPPDEPVLTARPAEPISTRTRKPKAAEATLEQAAQAEDLLPEHPPAEPPEV